MYILSYYEMAECPEIVKEQLRVLSFGPDAGGMWSWTFQTAGCYCATIEHEERVVAWSCYTTQIDRLPVVGCYTSEHYRGQGLGSTVAGHLLRCLELTPGTAIYAVSEYWASWPKVLSSAGLVHFEWA